MVARDMLGILAAQLRDVAARVQEVEKELLARHQATRSASG
jgi:hypothetical protein